MTSVAVLPSECGPADRQAPHDVLASRNNASKRHQAGLKIGLIDQRGSRSDNIKATRTSEPTDDVIESSAAPDLPIELMHKVGIMKVTTLQTHRNPLSIGSQLYIQQCMDAENSFSKSNVPQSNGRSNSSPPGQKPATCHYQWTKPFHKTAFSSSFCLQEGDVSFAWLGVQSGRH